MTNIDISRELDALDITNFQKNRFIPLQALNNLFTSQLITALLSQNAVKFHNYAEATSRILNNGTRVFATLACIHHIELITRFLASDSFSDAQLDSKLPMNLAGIREILKDESICVQFFEKQWRFIAPVFQENQCPRELSEWAILPFLERKKIGSGGFAIVYKVIVDASHHRIAGTHAQIELVCKQLSMTDTDDVRRADFEHEIEILSSLRCLNHPNIIRLISAFTQGEEYNFMFPCADGDLAALLQSPHPGKYFASSDDILSALWGLSSGLQAVHTFFAHDYNIRQVGCHYDIKPQNILCIGGKLVLSDFGLSRLKPEEEGSRSLFKRGEGSYMAPECEPCDEDFKPGSIGRSSDVWSLGCVLLEVLVYVSAEPGEASTDVGNFRISRLIRLKSCLGRHFHSTDGINPAVIKCLDKYAIKYPLTSPFRLLADLITDILQFEPELRPTAATVTRRLSCLAQQNVLDKTLLDLQYCVSHTQSNDLGLLIECWRLRIWGEVVGSYSIDDDTQDSKSLSPNSIYQLYNMTHRILQSCRVEVQHIVAQLQDDKDPPYKLSRYLQKNLDNLWDMQSVDTRRKMAAQLEEHMLGAEIIADSSNKTQRIIQSISIGDGDQYRRIVYLATMKEVAWTISQQLPMDQNLLVDKSAMGPPTRQMHSHILKTLEGRRVLIEFLEYQDSWNTRVTELIARVKSIAYTLNRRRVDEDIFPVLECIGYFHDVPNPRFGIVYRLPHLAKGTNPMNLVDIIATTQSRTKQPSLTKKFDLASSLVSHVLDFHLGGWLHKNICSFNIICFPDVFDSLAQSLSSPYFIGFNRCRLNNENAFTVPSGPELEYQHPTYLKNSNKSFSDPEDRTLRFRQEFDYYSVGLVLTEIAFWKSLAVITKNIQGAPEKLLLELLRTQIPLVRSYMGDAYAQAIEHCLTCYDDNHCDDEVAREEFRSHVVLPIQQRSI